MKIYGDSTSGNCLKPKFAAERLGLPYDWVNVNWLDGENRTPEHLARNPFGQVPVLELDDGRFITQSNAMLRYLARGSDLLPDDPYTQAQIDDWLFWEQYSHEPYLGVCRSTMVYYGKRADEREPWRVERGEKALDHIETQLAGRAYLVGETLTIADIALFPYTNWAHEGGFDLTPRRAVRTWLSRCAADLGTS